MDESDDIIYEQYKKAVQSIKALSIDCGKDNWDGYGAKSVSQTVIDNAVKVLGMLPVGTAIPDTGAEPQGDVALDWYDGQSTILSISVGEDNFLPYAWCLAEGGKKGHGVFKFENELPKEMIDLINKVTKPTA